MAKQLINLGTPNGRDGDTVRVAFNKINDNFRELYVGLDLSNVATNVRPSVSGTYDLGAIDRTWHALWIDIEGVHIGENRLSVNDQGAVTVNGDVVATPNGDPVQADWLATSGPSAILNKPTLSAVATSNDYRQLSHKPTIPTHTSQLDNDAGFTTFSGSWTDLTNKPTLFNGSYLSLTNRPSLFSGSYLDLVHKPTLFSGSYLDLSNRPTIPTDVNQLTDIDSLLGAGGGTVDTSPYNFSTNGMSWTNPDEPPQYIGGWFANASIFIDPSLGTVISNGVGGLGSQQWLFGTDGALRLPTSATIGGSGLNIDITAGAPPDPINGAGGSITLAGADAGDIGGDVVLQGGNSETGVGGSININAGAGLNPGQILITSNGNTWAFTDDGRIRLPAGGDIVDSSDQTVLGGGGGGSTAWSSITDINNDYGPQKLAIGYGAGQVNQGTITLALGYYAGHTGQGNYAVAIGQSAGQVDQGANAIAIGALAGQVSQPANSISLNASGSMTTPTGAGFYVNPVRQVTGGAVPPGFYPTYYNPTTGEFIVVTP